MSRIREIGVLRTVGYRRWHIALAFLIESLIPALAGGAVACLLAPGLNGFALRIPMGAFRFEVGPFLLGAGMGLSVLIGILGAAWPLLAVVAPQDRACHPASLKPKDTGEKNESNHLNIHRCDLRGQHRDGAGQTGIDRRGFTRRQAQRFYRQNRCRLGRRRTCFRG
jgi:hypothetical protein